MSAVKQLVARTRRSEVNRAAARLEDLIRLTKGEALVGELKRLLANSMLEVDAMREVLCKRGLKALLPVGAQMSTIA